MNALKKILYLGFIITVVGCKTNIQKPSHSKNDRLKEGPRSPGPHGPMSAADFNRDGTVTKAEIDKFIAHGPERKVGLVAYFKKYDTNNDNQLTTKELNLVKPQFAFDGTDANGDGVVSLNEVENYVKDRLYRQMGLDEFFNLIDINNDGEVSPEEIEIAHQKGQLPRG